MSVIKSFAVGNGDMFYIKHGNSNFTIIDCNLKEELKDGIVDELIRESKYKDIIRFISTHPDEDHILGLEFLDEVMGISNFYCVDNEANKEDCTKDFQKYCDLRDSNKSFKLEKGCRRCWLNRDDQDKQYGSSGISILWPVVNNKNYQEELDNAKSGSSPNNISPVIKYSLNNGVTVLWFGDLENSFMKKIMYDVELEKADIIFAPHHGRRSGRIPKEWLDAIKPKIIVVGEADSEVLEYYQGYNTITQNSAGDIIFDCDRDCVDIFVSNAKYEVDFLEDNFKDYKNDAHYIGSLEI